MYVTVVYKLVSSKRQGMNFMMRVKIKSVVSTADTRIQVVFFQFHPESVCSHLFVESHFCCLFVLLYVHFVVHSRLDLFISVAVIVVFAAAITDDDDAATATAFVCFTVIFSLLFLFYSLRFLLVG